MVDSKSKVEEIVYAVFKFLLQNALDLTTFGIALYIFVTSNFGQQTSDSLLTTIVGLLGVMAISDLIFRQVRLRKLEKLSEKMNDSLMGIVKNVLFPYRIDQISEEVEQASTVILVGNTLRTSAYYLYDEFVNGLKKGLCLKVIMMDFTHDEAIETLCNMYLGSKNRRTTAISLMTSCKKICNIGQSLPVDANGMMELGLFPSTLRYGMIVIDPEKASGKIYLKLYRHNHGRFRPVIFIEKSKYPDWFDLFYDQALELWKICEEKGRVIRGGAFQTLAHELGQEMG
jgi:hypothetical protein